LKHVVVKVIDDTLRNLTFPRSFQLEDGHQMSDLHH
jgi:hypothetical protein